MIGRLTGSIEASGPEHILLDVGGVGYLVTAGARTLRALSVGQKVSLHIHTHMSENAIRLYGFATEAECAWFLAAQDVPGVGAKAALSLLDALDPGALTDAVALGDVAAIQTARGIGRKIAERIITEFKNKPPPLGFFLSGRTLEPIHAAPPRHAGVVSALVNLGYTRAEAANAAMIAVSADDTGDTDTDEAELIRAALKTLART